MKKKLICLFSACLFLSAAFAQKNFKDGYIITNDYDTVFGQIDYRGDYLMCSVCRFRLPDSAKITEYYPDDLIAYRFIDSKYFVSKVVLAESGMQKVFLEYLLNGQLNVYYLRQENDHYYIEKEGEGIIELPYEQEYRFKNNAKYLYQSKKHVGLLQYYMSDAPEMKDELQKIIKPSHSNLVKAAENYHNIVCSNHECINYEKVVPFITLCLEATSGFIHIKPYRDIYGIERRFNDVYKGGLFAHINLTRANEKLYLKTGFQYYKSYQFEENIYSIPIHIEYISPNGLIRPTISYGYNLNSIGDISISMDTGTHIRINDKVFVSVLLSLEFGINETIGVIPHERYNHSLMAGLFYDL